MFFSPRDEAFAKKYPALAALPCVLDGRPSYHRLANLYLMERALGFWRPDGVYSGIPTKTTIRNYAHWLANFLEWTETRGVDLKTCSYYVHVVGRYQPEMLEGTWSRDGKGRSPSTVNARVQQACDFLTWMQGKGFREGFEVPYDSVALTVGSATRSKGRFTSEVQVRRGKARDTVRSLNMPEKAAVRRWLADMYDLDDAAFGLMSETVLFTAMRREEVTSLRINTLPTCSDEWVISNPNAPEEQRLVRISIKYGTKGPSYGEDHGDKIGPERSILMPLSLAQRWHAYRNGPRNLAFKRWMSTVKGASARLARANDAVHLFLRARDGNRFSGKELYDAWVGVELPVSGWSPHQGRHWWACSVLLRELQKQEIIGQLSNETAIALLESSALSVIRLQIQPQLGHSHDSTTMIYLKWVVDVVSQPISLADDNVCEADV